MRNIKRAFWGLLIGLSALWLLDAPSLFRWRGVLPCRGAMVQYSGYIAMGCMSAAMILALRLRRLESWFGGLDKTYRLHKWLGIMALIASVFHWFVSEMPHVAVALGWLKRVGRATGPVIDNPIARFFMSQHELAEDVGEWAFYAVVILIALALIRRFPYRWFAKSHRLLAIVYLGLVFHSVALLRFEYWTRPAGIVMAMLLAGGTFGAMVSLLGLVGWGRKVKGKIASMEYHQGVKVLEVEIDISRGWPGHRPGQFAFVTSDPSEGAHPYTIASAWDEQVRRIAFVVKELGDHTRRLRRKLHICQEVTVEGPYGGFYLDSRHPRQVWIGGGIGIAPFLAGLKHIAQQRRANPDGFTPLAIDLFHTTADHDAHALAKLGDDAQAAGVRLHVLLDSRDGLLTGDRIRTAVPDWRDAGIWFCGPSDFGQALRRDFAAHGLAVDDRFHQELFEMR